MSVNPSRTQKLIGEARTKALIQELDEFAAEDNRRRAYEAEDSDDSLKDKDFTLEDASMNPKGTNKQLTKASKRRKLDFGNENVVANCGEEQLSHKPKETKVLRELQQNTPFEKDSAGKHISFKNFHSDFKKKPGINHASTPVPQMESTSFKSFLSNSKKKPENQVSTLNETQMESSSCAKLDINSSSVPGASVPPTCPSSKGDHASTPCVPQMESTSFKSFLSNSKKKPENQVSTLNETQMESSSCAKLDINSSSVPGDSVPPTCPSSKGESDSGLGEDRSLNSSSQETVSKLIATNATSKPPPMSPFDDLGSGKMMPSCTDSGVKEDNLNLSLTVKKLSASTSCVNSDSSPSSAPIKPVQPSPSVTTAKDISVNKDADTEQSGSSPMASFASSRDSILETPRGCGSSHNLASTPITSASSRQGSHTETLNDDAFDIDLYTPQMILQELRKTQNGRTVLQWFKDRKSLNSRKRSLLVTILIDKELNEDASKLISSERFLAMAEAICNCFSSEIRSTYYIPRHRNKFNKVFRAKGKLYDRWLNVRRSFRADNMIIGRKNLGPSNSSDASESDDDECTDDQLTWTRTRSEYPEAIPYFRSTCRARVKEFLQKGPRRKIAEFLKKYPAYTSENGYLLIEKDFDLVYPGNGKHFLGKWGQFATKITEHAVEKLSWSTNFKRLLTNHKIDLTEEDENKRTINALHLLPLLLPCKTDILNFKPFKSEAKDAFLLHAATYSEAERKLFLRKQRLEAYDIPEPPTPVVVANECNVCIDDIVYACESPLAAIDICCKLQFLLQTDLPPDCRLSLLFLKAYLYNIEPDMAEEFQCLSTLKNDIKL